MSTARTPVSFIPLIRNYLPILINHHTTAFLKLPGVLNQQPQRLIRKCSNGRSETLWATSSCCGDLPKATV